MVYDLKEKEKFLHIRKCNNVTNNSEKRNSGKKKAQLQVPKVKYGYQIKVIVPL